MLDYCTSTCGWLAAIVSCITFGSFAVPIKSPEALSVDIDPLVFHSYKVIMCFAASFIVLPLGQEFYFSPWGIVSSVFWVPASIASVIAVKNAGLAVSQGTWSTGIVLVSFVWGIFIFHESVKSKLRATFSVTLIIVGLWGMSFYSSPEASSQISLNSNNPSSPLLKKKFQDENDGEDHDEEKVIIPSYNSYTSRLVPDKVPEEDGATIKTFVQKNANFRRVDELRKDLIKLQCLHSSCEAHFSRRMIGLLAAIFNGLWGGSVLVPMHFAPPEASGLGFVISFAIGAVIVTIFAWFVRYIYNFFYNSKMSFSTAYESLPSFHFGIIWLPSLISATLWNIGHISSMISVMTLGQGIGYSVTQSSMLVSGLWGIFYFEEVQTFEAKMKWFAAAVLTIVGILHLSYEH